MKVKATVMVLKLCVKGDWGRLEFNNKALLLSSTLHKALQHSIVLREQLSFCLTIHGSYFILSYE